MNLLLKYFDSERVRKGKEVAVRKCERERVIRRRNRGFVDSVNICEE